jgi:S-adenosyl methyltransferase
MRLLVTRALSRAGTATSSAAGGAPVAAWRRWSGLPRFLADEAGVRQFLDIGTGIPSAGNTREVAQAAAPESGIVYVDNDPIVLAHARALLTSTPEGAGAYLDTDLKDTGKILREAARTLDFARPVAVLFIGVLLYEQHLREVLAEYTRHCNGHRTAPEPAAGTREQGSHQPGFFLRANRR